MAIAIDFGTSNTVITRWNAATQQAETLSLAKLSQKMPGNPPLIPSLIYVEDASAGKVIAGQEVRDRGLDFSNNPRFFQAFKRGIGAEIPGFLPELDEKLVNFEQVGQWYLTTLLEQVKQEYPDALDSVVVTVPVNSFEIYRHWLNEVFQSLDVEKVRILDEPTAAALGYGTTQQKVLLVIDFGGGTLDFSLVQLDLGASQTTQGFLLKWGDRMFGEQSGQKPKVAKVLAKAGQTLGGSDIDNWIVNYFAKEQGIPKSPLTTRLAERLKIKLSKDLQGQEVYFNDETLETYQLALDRSTFEKILQEHQFLDRLNESMTQVWQQAERVGIESTEVDAVLLVGGSSKIPIVQNWIKEQFDADKIHNDRPFEAIASGALGIVEGIEVKDFLYHSYGIRYWNRQYNRHSWHPIIRTGQPYPMSKAVELNLGASMENQSHIELIIGELGTDTGSTEVYLDGDRLVTRQVNSDQVQVQPLNDREGARTIANLNPAGYPGSDRIRVVFLVDEYRFLRMSVEDLLTHELLVRNAMVAQLS